MDSFDQATFPVSRDQPFIDLGWPIMNADHLLGLTTTILTLCPRTTLGMTKAQPAVHFAALTRREVWHR